LLEITARAFDPGKVNQDRFVPAADRLLVAQLTGTARHHARRRDLTEDEQAAAVTELLDQVPDPRKRRGRRHPLARLLAVGIAAVIAGSRSFAAIGQWAADAGAEVLAGLGAARGPAEESTFRRAFAMIDPGQLDQVLGAWLWTRAVQVSGRLVIAVDGKAVRGAKDKAGKAPHLVAALAHGIGAVLGQTAVTARRPLGAPTALTRSRTPLTMCISVITSAPLQGSWSVTPSVTSIR
jgi:hypothetical protein